MTSFDHIVLSVVFLSGLIGFARGFVREILAVTAWAGAAVVAVMFLPSFRHLFDWVPEPDWADRLTVTYLFVMALGIFYLVASAIGHAVRSSVIGAFDRSLGLGFGVARAAIPVTVTYLVVNLILPVAQWPEPVLRSRSLPYIHDSAAWLVRQIPEEYRPPVPPD